MSKGFGKERSVKQGSAPKKVGQKYLDILNVAINNHAKGNLKKAETGYKEYLETGQSDPAILTNLALLYKQTGRYDKAIDLYKKIISTHPSHADALSNLGNLLKELGNLKEAKEYSEKAITLNPNCAYANLNLSSILIDLSRLDEAEIYIRKAIDISPELKKAHFNLAVIEMNKGELINAEKNMLTEIRLNKNYCEAYNVLSTILIEQKRYEESMQMCINAIRINPQIQSSYMILLQIVKQADLNKITRANLRHILNLLISRSDLDIQELFRAFDYIYKDICILESNKNSSSETRQCQYNELIHEKLFINALAKIRFTKVGWEKYLTHVRKILLVVINKDRNSISRNQIELTKGIAKQCFLNEYIYEIDSQEKDCIIRMISSCKDKEVDELVISIIACYLPIYSFFKEIKSIINYKSKSTSFNELLKIQLYDPLIERKLAIAINENTSLNNKISKKVKTQYEKNPYPRWTYTEFINQQKLARSCVINSEIKPNTIRERYIPDQPKVLIAGCGTGRQVIQAQRYRNAIITAIDVSTSSLGYAQRKANEYGIKNVEFLEMDILNINQLNYKFDIIECSGVLHHMEHPIDGLSRLTERLKSSGYLKLGLYSQYGRADVIKAKTIIKSENIKPSEKEIKTFRNKIINGQYDGLDKLAQRLDFYSISECIDLLFNVKEHRFNITDIKKILSYTNLEFLGFFIDEEIKSIYQESYPKDDSLTCLVHWNEFEKNNPNIFRDMYQFWTCLKT